MKYAKLLILITTVTTNFHVTKSTGSNEAIKEKESDTPKSSQLTYLPEDAIKVFKEGLKSASNKMGLVTTLGLPDMILSTINTLTKIPTSNVNIGLLQSNNLFNGFFRLLGFDTDKLQAIALNAIVFIAQMIGSNLTNKQLKDDKLTIKKDNGKIVNQQEGDFKDDTSLHWVLQNAPKEVKNIIIEAQQSNLPENIMKNIKELSKEPSQDGYCVQHLICRLTPIIRGMQENTKYLITEYQSRRNIKSKITEEEWSKLSPSDRMYAFMPSNDDFKKQKEICEKDLPPCVIKN